MASERDLIAAAKGGDERAFESLVSPYRQGLRSHAYRMLGSMTDAEEALQDTLLGAWRGLGRFEERSSLRSWLFTIATNASLKLVRERKRRLPADSGGGPSDPRAEHAEPLAESVWLEPIPEAAVDDAEPGPQARYEHRESLELAFVAALQHLPPRQRAALLLRDVLAFSAREAAQVLQTSPESIDSALQRAHKAVQERLPSESQQAVRRSLGDAELGRMVDDYVEAFEAADVSAVVGMLAEEARLSMPPLPEWYLGRDAIATYMEARHLEQWSRRFVPTRANCQPAAAHYIWEESEGAYVAHAIHVLTLSGERIADITLFVFPDRFAAFGLPPKLDP